MLELMLCKRCASCGETKPAEVGFYADSKMADGYRSRCRACYRAEYAANREARIEYGRAYYAANREQRLAYQNRYYAANQEQRLAYQRAYADRNRDAVRKRNRDYMRRRRTSRN